MINRGLIAKGFRESWAVTLTIGLALAVAEAVWAYVLPTYQQQFNDLWQQFGFIRNIAQALFGTDLPEAGPELLNSFAWVHPVVLALLWAHAITFCTRVPAGEVDRGTIDVLLGLPVSRGELYRTETVLWLASGAGIVLLGLLGYALGSLSLPAELRPDPYRSGIIATNMFCLYLAVGGLSWFASSLSDRRGRAVGVTLGVMLASFLVNYLAQFWSVAERLSALSLLHYYNPPGVLRDGSWPAGDMAVLIVAATALWAGAGAIFARRDLSTV